MEFRDVNFVYGDNHDFSKNDGVAIADKEIQSLIDEVLDILKNNNEPYAFVGTGDTLVFGFLLNDGRLSHDSLELFVCKNYEVAEAWKNHDDKWEKMDWTIDYEYEERKKELEKYTREELIDIILNNDSWEEKLEQ